MDAFGCRHSVSQKLWTGQLGNGGSVTVPGLAGAKVIGLRFEYGPDIVHPIVLKSGETTFGVTEQDGFGSYWDEVSFYGIITVGGNSVSCSKCGMWISRSTGLGNPFVLVAGDNHTITEIWRIL